MKESGVWQNAEISSAVDVAITYFDCRYSGETLTLYQNYPQSLQPADRDQILPA